jgi:hypothetical protein
MINVLFAFVSVNSFMLDGLLLDILGKKTCQQHPALNYYIFLCSVS